MSADKHMMGIGRQLGEPSQPSSARDRIGSWLSTGLIVAGLLLLGAGGVMAYWNSWAIANPPGAVGMGEPPPPPSLAENPLPVVDQGGLPAMPAAEAAPTPTPTPEPTLVPAASASDRLEPAQPTPVPLPASSQEADGYQARTEPTQARVVPAIDPEAEKVLVTEAAALAGPADTVSASPPTRILAPAIELDAEIISIGWKQELQGSKLVSVWEVAEYAAGWHKNSSRPGNGGNIVVSGHHNVKGEVFRYVVDLDPGDEITLFADGRPYTYTVESRFVVRDKGMSEEKRRENARWIGPFPDERLTLVTCWPYTSNTHRVIVIAKPVR